MPDENENNTNGYDADSMEGVITSDEFNNSPEWFKERMGKMARQKNEARETSDTLRSQMDTLRGEINDVRSLAQTVPEPVQDNSDKPFVQRSSPTELRAAATKIMDLQGLSNDPDVTPEQRAAARDQLSGLGNVSEILFDIHQEIATRGNSSTKTEILGEIQQHNAATDARNALVNKLFTSFGNDAINKNSLLSQAAFAKIQGWTKEHGLTAERVDDFMTYKAFQEAASEQKSQAPGGRGADPRTSPVLGGAGANPNRSGDTELAALAKRAEQGDWKAGRKASAIKFEEFLKNSGLRAPD